MSCHAFPYFDVAYALGLYSFVIARVVFQRFVKNFFTLYFLDFDFEELDEL